MLQLVQGDCLEYLKTLPDDMVDLVVTSPPYADRRKKTYGGIPFDEYVDWFLPISAELLRTLSPTGTFILNIKESVCNGERSTYVLDLIKALREQGWLWTEEFIWHKKNATPGKWPNRFRDAWERLLQFNKQKKFKMNQESVMVPIGDWAKTRLKKLSETDKERHNSETESGFGRKVANWKDRDMVYPDNVLYQAAECGNRKHSAVFPEWLPEWFIKLFTDEGDLVLDPFVGSGTTMIASHKLGRNCTGVEILDENCSITTERLNSQGATHEYHRLDTHSQAEGEEGSSSGGIVRG